MSENSIKYSYDLVKSNRKTYALTINKEGKLIVKTPMKYSQKFVDEFLKNHSVWIEKYMAKTQEKLSKKPNYKFENGEMITLLGEKIPLIISNTAPFAYNFDYKNFIVHSSYTDNIKKYLEDTFRKVAKIHFKKRLDEFSKQFNIPYKSMKLSSAEGRWGSCSSRGNINLVWRLIMAPKEVIDYVIIHELAHIKHHDHSAAFWSLVQYMMPNYRDCEKWLKDNSYSLSWE